MFYLRLFIGADEAVSSTSRPDEFSSPHTNKYFTNVLFPEPPMFEFDSWNSDLFFDKLTTEYSPKLSFSNTLVLPFAFSSNYHLEAVSEILYNNDFINYVYSFGKLNIYKLKTFLYVHITQFTLFFSTE